MRAWRVSPALVNGRQRFLAFGHKGVEFPALLHLFARNTNGNIVPPLRNVQINRTTEHRHCRWLRSDESKQRPRTNERSRLTFTLRPKHGPPSGCTVDVVLERLTSTVVASQPPSLPAVQPRIPSAAADGGEIGIGTLPIAAYGAERKNSDYPLIFGMFERRGDQHYPSQCEHLEV